jgi:hypothetical protein
MNSATINLSKNFKTHKNQIFNMMSRRTIKPSIEKRAKINKKSIFLR